MSIERDRADILAGCDLKILQQGRNDAAARGDLALADACDRAMKIRAVSQTPEIAAGGRLFEHVEPPSRENGNRHITTYTGDPLAWMAPFMTPGAVSKLNKNVGIVARQTVRLRSGERVQIVQSDGTIRRGDF